MLALWQLSIEQRLYFFSTQVFSRQKDLFFILFGFNVKKKFVLLYLKFDHRLSIAHTSLNYDISAFFNVTTPFTLSNAGKPGRSYFLFSTISYFPLVILLSNSVSIFLPPIFSALLKAQTALSEAPGLVKNKIKLLHNQFLVGCSKIRNHFHKVDSF